MAKKKKLPVEQVDETQSIVDRIVSLEKQIDLDLPEETEELWSFVIRLENEASVNLAKRGLAYMMLKEKSEPADFIRELESKDIPKRHAQNAMSVAKMLMQLPAKKAQSVALIGNTKLIELARIPSETFDDLTENGELDLDEVDQMSLRELKLYVRALKSESAAAVFKQEAAELKVLDILSQNEAAPETDLHPIAAKVRMDSAVLSQQAIDNTDAMQSLFDELTHNSMDLFKHHSAQFDSAKASLYLHLKSIQAKASITLEAFLNAFGEVEISAEDIPFMTEAEAIHFLNIRKVATLESRADQIARDSIIQEKTAKHKPGPKKGSKRKKPAASKKASK